MHFLQPYIFHIKQNEEFQSQKYYIVCVEASIVGQEINTGHFEELLSSVKQGCELFLLTDVTRHEADIVRAKPLLQLLQGLVSDLLVDV